MFYDKFKALCDSIGISCNKAATDIGLSNATPTTWKKRGLTPKGETLSKLSDYFVVPLDFFVGRPPFDCWDLINQNRKGFLHYVDIDPDMLQITWGIDPEDPDAAPMKDFISFLSLAIENARPTSEGDWEVTLRPSFKKEKAHTSKGVRKLLPPDAIPIDLSKYHQIPILGRISAGLPIYADEHIEGYTLTDLNGGAEYFALRVRGDSMNAIRINDGDIIIIRRQDEVEQGEIAVVLVDEQDATVKRFYSSETTVTLMPQSTNPEHKPQMYDLSKTRIKVLGKAIKVEFTL